LIRIRTRGVSSRRIGPDTLLLDFQTSRYLRLNGTGTMLYRLLGEGRSRDELVTAMVVEYDIETTTAANDVDDFLGMLQHAGLIEATVRSAPQ
jgi:hypothetical protein